jgi:hypothetical protein
MDWLLTAADNFGKIEALLLANYPLTHVQLDAISDRGSFWRGTAIDIDTR